MFFISRNLLSHETCYAIEHEWSVVEALFKLNRDEDNPIIFPIIIDNIEINDYIIPRLLKDNNITLKNNNSINVIDEIINKLKQLNN